MRAFVEQFRQRLFLRPTNIYWFALEHCRGGTGNNARRVRALIAPRYLMCAPRLRKNADVDVLDVGARDTDGHDVLRLARGCARMATDATGVVDHLCPLHVSR